MFQRLFCFLFRKKMAEFEKKREENREVFRVMGIQIKPIHSTTEDLTKEQDCFVTSLL